MLIELNKEVTPALIKKMKPDVVIIATGAHPLIPDIPGINADNVVTYEDVFSGKIKIGQEVVILGGGSVGCEIAHYLAEESKDVTIIETLPKVASKVSVMVKVPLLNILKEKGVVIITNAQIREITSKGARINVNGGPIQDIEGDHVVVAAGAIVNDNLQRVLREIVPEVHTIGDAAKPQFIKEALSEGFLVGASV